MADRKRIYGLKFRELPGFVQVDLVRNPPILTALVPDKGPAGSRRRLATRVSIEGYYNERIAKHTQDCIPGMLGVRIVPIGSVRRE